MSKISLTQEAKDALVEALNDYLPNYAGTRYTEQKKWFQHAIHIVESFPVSDGWIPCSERLPENLQWCHTFGEFWMTDACWYPKQKIWVHPENLHEWIHVTHWKPLPNPPTSHK